MTRLTANALWHVVYWLISAQAELTNDVFSAV